MPASPRLAWWQTGVVYQVYPRSFQDADGDGVGDLAGVIGRLDHLAWLGVDAVWLSPFYPSPMADFGYDVADYCAVDPLFGDLATFDRLVEAAHERGLRVIVDFVPNHSSDQHAWFRESRSGRASPKRDWYVWRDPKPDGSPPNNWLGVFGGSAWELDEATGQYYLHSFLKEQPDLNWRNAAVREAMADVLRFWMARGVDGFRLDALHFIAKDPEERDNPPNPSAEGAFHKPLGEYDTQLHLYDKGHADIHAWLRDLRRLLDAEGRDVVAIGEMHLYDWDVWASYFGGNEGGEPLDELHLPFNFALLNTAWRADAVRATVDALEAALPDGAWPNWVLGNHDETRLLSRVGPAQARVAAVLLLTLRGTPTLYYGDEIGMPEVAVPAERQQDPWGFMSLPELSRDGARTPMAWDASLSAGFSEAPPDALWLPLHPDHEAVNVEAARADPDSLLHLYRRLLALRRAAPALHAGRYRPVDDVPAAAFAFEREHDGARVLVALNFSGEAQRVPLPAWAQGCRVLLSTRRAREGERVGEGLHLGGDEAVVVGESR